MIDSIEINATGVEYEFTDEAPPDAEVQLAAACYPTNPTIIKDILQE